MNRPNRSRSPSNARATARPAGPARRSPRAGAPRSPTRGPGRGGTAARGTGSRRRDAAPASSSRRVVEPDQPGIGEAVVGGVEGERDRDDGDGARAGRRSRACDGGQGLVRVGGVADGRIVVVGGDGVGEGRERVGRRRIGVRAAFSAPELLDLVADRPPDVGSRGGGGRGRVGRLGDGQRGRRPRGVTDARRRGAGSRTANARRRRDSGRHSRDRPRLIARVIERAGSIRPAGPTQPEAPKPSVARPARVAWPDLLRGPPRGAWRRGRPPR